uniref:Uncharacterized protein n=1 Tax=Meloidogyne enterolobii TaxID=390850 RepID=A0A6V7U1M5_MELEN|nr:unnamed protein product [Meloidogyne enterolobii]
MVFLLATYFSITFGIVLRNFWTSADTSLHNWSFNLGAPPGTANKDISPRYQPFFIPSKLKFFVNRSLRPL